MEKSIMEGAIFSLHNKNSPSAESQKTMTLDELKQYHDKADASQQEVRTGKNSFPWDEREDLFYGRYKHPEEKTKSILSTGELTTLNIDRACRVMAQLPQGKFYNYNGNPGANMAMNVIFEYYVLPRAIQGGTMLSKLRTIDMYSGVFGTVPAFIDWVVTPKYVGPDLRMVHPRRFRPQAGKLSLAEMEITFLDTEVSTVWLEGRKGQPGWNTEAIDKIIERHKKDDGEGPDDTERSPDERGKTKSGITIKHCFHSNGDWDIVDTQFSEYICQQKDYFCGISISVKNQYPKLDSFWAYSDFERGELTQKSIDTVTRLYLDSVEATINPPKIYDPEKVYLASMKTKDWYVKGDGRIDVANLNPQGMNTYQGVYQILKGNLMSLGATTDTSVSKTVDPGMGKTPQALKMQGDRQGARDAWDSYMMKEFIEDAFTKMADLIAKKGVNAIAFQLLDKAIAKIKEQYPDSDYSIFGEAFEYGVVNIDPKYLEGQYRYVMDEGSTMMKKDDTGAKLIDMLTLYSKNPQIQADLQLRGERVDFGEAFKRILLDQGIQDADRILVQAEDPESMAGVGAEGATADPMIQEMTPEMMQLPTDIQQPGLVMNPYAR